MVENRTRKRPLALAVTLAAVVTAWSALALAASSADPVSEARTALSLKGEVRWQARALARCAKQALARGDTVLAWVQEPIVRGILGKQHPLSRELAALDASIPPAQIAREVADAERRFAGELAGIGEPLLTALLGHVSDRVAEPDARCVLIRTLAVRWPERLAPQLARVLASESYPITLGEAAVCAGRISGQLPSPGLVPDLRAAVGRLRGWGRQYAILGLSLADDRESVAEVRAALSDREVAVRRHAMLYLAGSGDMSNMRVLHEMARHDPDATTRKVAAVALSRLIGVELPRFAASPDEVRAAWRRGPHRPAEETVTVRQIVALGEGARAETRVAAAHARIAAGESFEAVARSASDDRGITRLGHAVPLGRARFAPDLWAAIAPLAPGQVSPPVHASGCWHLVQLVGRAPAREPVFADEAPALAERLIEQKRLAFVQNAMLPRMAMFRAAVHE